MWQPSVDCTNLIAFMDHRIFLSLFVLIVIDSFLRKIRFSEGCPIRWHHEIPGILYASQCVPLSHSASRTPTKQYVKKFLRIRGNHRTLWNQSSLNRIVHYRFSRTASNEVDLQTTSTTRWALVLDSVAWGDWSTKPRELTKDCSYDNVVTTEKKNSLFLHLFV